MRISAATAINPINTGDVDCRGMIPHLGHFSFRRITVSPQLWQIFTGIYSSFKKVSELADDAGDGQCQFFYIVNIQKFVGSVGIGSGAENTGN